MIQWKGLNSLMPGSLPSVLRLLLSHSLSYLLPLPPTPLVQPNKVIPYQFWSLRVWGWFLPSGREWKPGGEVPDGVCCVSVLHSHSTASSLLPGQKACRLYFPDLLSTWLPVKCYQWEALAGVWKVRGKKKTFFRRLGCALAEATTTVTELQQRQRRQWWLRPRAGFWVSANSANAILTATHCALWVTFFLSLRSFRSGGGSFLQLPIFGKSYLPTFSPLPTSSNTFTTNCLFENQEQFLFSWLEADW